MLENAIAQSSVLGKEGGEEAPEDNQGEQISYAWDSLFVTMTVSFVVTGSTASGPILSFSGDAEDMGDGEDKPVDLFAQAAAEEDQGEDDDEKEEDDGEPEDDFNAAWEVLDLARAIYEKESAKSEDEEVKLKLADTFIALGDVSLETGMCHWFFYSFDTWF